MISVIRVSSIGWRVETAALGRPVAVAVAVAVRCVVEVGKVAVFKRYLCDKTIYYAFGRVAVPGSSTFLLQCAMALAQHASIRGRQFRCFAR